MSAPTYWLSASVLTITSAPARRLASIPVMNARASPRLTSWLTTWCTPHCRATSTVRSLLPSSITSNSMTSIPGSDRGRSAIVPGSVSSSLKHGIWMISLTGSAGTGARLVTAPADGPARRTRLRSWLSCSGIDYLPT